MFKNKFVVLSLVALSFLAGILLFSFSPNIETFAQRVLRSNTLYENNWQYCAITRINVVNPPPDRLDEFVGAVTIDYFEYSKDRVTLKESYVRSECLFEKLNYAEFLQDNSLKHSPRAQQLASSKTADLALARAMTKLGGSGWEMVGRNFANVNFETLDGNANYKNALYFRKLVSQKQTNSQY